jgi:hypothetical protein
VQVLICASVSATLHRAIKANRAFNGPAGTTLPLISITPDDE